MSNQPENKSEKLNKLNLNKETITDLDAPNSQEIKGGGVILPTGQVACPGTLAKVCAPPTGLVTK